MIRLIALEMEDTLVEMKASCASAMANQARMGIGRWTMLRPRHTAGQARRGGSEQGPRGSGARGVA